MENNDTKDKDSETRLPTIQVSLDPVGGGKSGDYLVGTEIGLALDGPDLEKVVDADLERFAKFYRDTLGNDKLSDFERAAIKTFLWWKTHPDE